MMLRCGVGCAMNKHKAMALFELSGKQGNAGSKTCLGT